MPRFGISNGNLFLRVVGSVVVYMYAPKLSVNEFSGI